MVNGLVLWNDCTMWWIILPLIIVIIYFTLMKNRKESTKLHKGFRHLPVVPGIPVFGIFFDIKTSLCHHLLNLGKRHGNIFMIRLGMRDIIVLNDYEVLKKTLRDDGDNFSGRWKTNMEKLTTNNTGILFIDGDKWNVHRNFISKALKSFGFGKSKAEEIVQAECTIFINELHENRGNVTDFSMIINIYIMNIISMFVMGKRFEREDKLPKFVNYALDELARKPSNSRLLFDVSNLMNPILDKYKSLSKIVLGLSLRGSLYKTATEMFKQESDEHLKVLDMNSEPGNLTDRFLIEQHRLIEKNGTPENFTDQQLAISNVELFSAGFDTTSLTLGWSMLFMSRHFNVQKKVHDEIVNQIGSERMPNMNDKKFLIYTQAVMDEIMRLGSIAPLALVHRTLRDSTIDGYFIPKDCEVFPNLYACHRDLKIWEKPFEFYPEHFLSKSDDGVWKYRPRNELVPFGMGKRQCLGESLARMEYFIFFVSILQKFRVELDKEISDEEYKKVILANEGIFRCSGLTHFIFHRL